MSNGRWAFRHGERVTRPRDVWNPRSDLLHGTVVRRYQKRTEFGFYPEMYDVRWDGRTDVDCGFLPHGLSPENPAVAPLWATQTGDSTTDD